MAAHFEVLYFYFFIYLFILELLTVIEFVSETFSRSITLKMRRTDCKLGIFFMIFGYILIF